MPDASTRTITLRDGSTVQADARVIATGASAPQLPAVAGMTNVYTLHTLADAQCLASAPVPGNTMAVIGAGFIDAEAASAAVGQGMQVTLVDSKPVPSAGGLGVEAGAAVAGLHTAKGVKLVLSAVIEKFDSHDGKVTGLQLLGGSHVQADAVVVGICAEPNRGWLASSGLEPGAGIICDAMGCTNIPGLMDVSDCAAWFDPAAGTHRRAGHWTGALERAALAVRALLDPGAPEEPINLPTSGPASTASSCSSRDTPPVTTASRSRLATRRRTASLPLTTATRSPWLSSA